MAKLKNEEEVKQAFETIKKAMIDDSPSDGGSYAHAWHCVIACMCADAIQDDFNNTLTSKDAYRIGNEAATRFMKMCFDVATKN